MNELHTWTKFTEHPLYKAWVQKADALIGQTGESMVQPPNELIDLVKLQRLAGRAEGIRMAMAIPGNVIMELQLEDAKEHKDE